LKEDTKTIVLYRIERARESLEEADILLKQGFTNTYVNRLYYACFYAVSAILLSKGYASSKHIGIRSLMHQKLVKPGIVDVEMGRFYDRLFDVRQKGDYADLVRFDSDEVRPWMKEARNFVDSIVVIVEKELNAG